MQVLINIDVPDLEQGIAFYQRALPLTLARRMFDGTVAEMRAENVRIYLLEKPQGSAPFTHAEARDYGRHWTPVHLDFAVGDIETALTQALKAGAKQETEVDRAEWGAIVTLSDPFGNGFCLVRFEGGVYEHV
ncbi:MAG TPA: VOC family protein [Opitutus sp.]|nr:VOC family protein [Opitutus sp.]